MLFVVGLREIGGRWFNAGALAVPRRLVTYSVNCGASELILVPRVVKVELVLS